jgi:hypothetical protein
MSDFESGVEPLALNIYKGIILRKAMVLAGVSVWKAEVFIDGCQRNAGHDPRACRSMSQIAWREIE